MNITNRVSRNLSVNVVSEMYVKECVLMQKYLVRMLSSSLLHVRSSNTTSCL